MDKPLESYPYESLKTSSKEIRLVDLSPAGIFEHDITCALRTVSLDDEPGYETISYVWGDPNLRATINVNGRTVSVPASSAAVLRRVRQHDKPRTVWLDAICINQDDISEREQQVVLMKTIYSAGTGNLIHLGESATAKEEIVEMYKIHDEAKEMSGGFQQLRSILFDNVSGINTSSEARKDLHWELLRNFFKIPWFRRVWVMQEAALSRKNLCLYGDHDLPLLDVYRTIVWMRHRFNYIDSAGARDVIDSIAILWELIDQDYGRLRISGTSPGEVPLMINVLHLVRPLHASDQRDKVFGILGLLQDIPKDLLPDYEKPFEHVFRDATRCALEEHGAVNAWLVLEQISHRSQAEVHDPNWPSWVPRWNRPWDPTLDPSRNMRGWSADAGNAFQHESLENESSLTAYGGVLVAEVELVSSTLVDGGTPFTQWFQEVKQMSSSVDELSSVLLAGRNLQTIKLTKEDYVAIGASKSWLCNPNESLSNLTLSVKGSTDEETHAVADNHQRVLNVCKNRLVFKTTDGLLGVGPQMSKPKDIVVVLYGLEAPVILRPFRSNYKILGACYVHGIMDGEAVHKHKAENRLDQTFILC